MPKKGRNIVLCAVSLSVGGILYILFRENSRVGLLFQDVRMIIALREWFFPCGNDFLRYYLPDLLWGFSLSCGLVAVFGCSGWRAGLCAGVGFACGFLWEILQYCGLISGTGDLIDVGMYLSGSVICAIINLKKESVI